GRQAQHRAGLALDDVLMVGRGEEREEDAVDADRRLDDVGDEARLGRRYRRQDEIGTPYGITVDFDTVEKDAGVTVRDRDTLSQVRMTEDELVRFLDEKVNGA
ncbi:MAG: His/Gly/Thr/Pro-type tRNA ligase C-terminal domain-containing protein, partial [Verrucomicrobiota bacterium]